MKKTSLSIFLAAISLLCGAQNIRTYVSPYSVIKEGVVPDENLSRSSDGIRTASSIPLILEVPKEFSVERAVPKQLDGGPVVLPPMLDSTQPAFHSSEHSFGAAAGAVNASEEKPFLAIELFGCSPSIPIRIIEEIRLGAADAAIKRGRFHVADAQTVLGREYDGDAVYYGGRPGRFDMSTRLCELYSNGVRYVLSAVVEDYLTHVFESKDPKRPYRFETAFVFHVTGYDLDRQEILQTRLHVAHGQGRSQEEADNEALGYARTYISNYINTNFRRIGRIEGLGDPNKKDKIKTCTIKVGFADGAKKGDAYQVCTMGANGDTNNFGRVRITNVLTEDRSECTISAGREKFLEAVEADLPLIIVTD